MKHRSTFFLKSVLVMVFVAVLLALLWFPKNEGRAAHLDLISIYTDPFIIYIYIASIPFFVALIEAFKLLRYIDKNKLFFQAAVKAVKNIQYCAIAIIGFLIVALLYIRFMVHGDDPAGPTMLGFITIFVSAVIATVAGIFRKLLQNAVDMKVENDLTV